MILFLPKSPDVLRFVRKVKMAAGAQPVAAAAAPASRCPPSRPCRPGQPIRPYPAVDVGQRFAIKPKIEALAVVKGEYVCSNDDLIRNAAYSWSPMSAAEISQKTGIEERRYTGA